MNIQNKLYTVQFSHNPMTDLQSVPKQQSWNPELADFVNFTGLLKKTKLPEKFKLPDKRGFEPLQKIIKRKIPAPCPTPIYKLRTTSVVWNILVGWLGLSAWLCFLPTPAHLLISWTWETGKKVLDFLATTENTGVINILLVLNPKHNRYCEEN